MEEMEAIISDLKNCILIFKYPLADSMDDDHIAEIFHRSNRCFLVCWIINLLTEACDNNIQYKENTEKFLASLIHSMGFCQQKESIPFMRGELAMKIEVSFFYCSNNN